MPKFRKLFHSVFGGKHDDGTGPKSSEPDLPLGLPVLPPNRQHVLTPSASHEDLTRFIRPNGVFFEQFPRELRDQIYIAAFGERTVHMDLQFEYPRYSDLSRTLIHAQVNSYGRTDYNAGRRWAWWSSVCHRHPLAEAWDDNCQRGSPREMCDAFYSGEWPGKCFLGVMGWLLSCRQA